MAVMTATRTLRDAPFGNSLGIQVEAGVRVEILDSASSSLWTRIRLVDSDVAPKPEGWVSSHAVDPDSDTLGPLDRTLFATECVFHAESFGVIPHYIMSIADMRTNITDGPNANGIDYGPFALSPKEWAVFSNLAEFDMNLSEEHFRNWIAQCLVFSCMTNVGQRKLAGLLGNQPTAAQLALAQMIGAPAAAICVRSPGRTIEDVLSSMPETDLDADAVERDRLPARFDALLKGKNAEEALEAIAQSLQRSLDETRPFAERAGAAVAEFVNDLLEQIAPSSEFVSAEVLPNKTIKYTANDGSTSTRRGGSIAWRHNNPGNIRNSPFTRAHGAIADGPGFAIFPSEAVGFKAILSLLSGQSYRDLSLRDAINRYAPAADGNNPDQYVAFIVSTTGIPQNAVLKDLSNEQMNALGRAIQNHEGWTVGTEIRTASAVSVSGDVTAEAVVRSALREWEHWGRSIWNRITGVKQIGKTERSPGYAEYVYDNYYKAVFPNANLSGKASMVARIAERERPTYAWSAIAVSAILRNAGYTKQQFQFSEGHSRFIRNAVTARKNSDSAASFWGFRINEASPEAGDLVGYARGNISQQAAQAWFDRTDGYLSHTDIVVAVRQGEIDVVGGNVSDSVTMKTLPVDPASGRLVDQSHPWFVILKRRLPG